MIRTPNVEDHPTLEDWQEYPRNAWAFQNVRRLIPTAEIKRGAGPVCVLEENSTNVNDVSFDTRNGERVRVGDFIQATRTNGFIALQRGRILTEQYMHGYGPDKPHLLQSVSKSIVGSLAGVIADAGELKLTAPATKYVPELRDTVYHDALVRHLLDMTVACDSPAVTPDGSWTELHFMMDRAAGWAPARPGGPDGVHDVLRHISSSGAQHGVEFRYTTATTNALAWIIEKVTGQHIAELVSGQIWSSLGTEHDGYVTVDRHGTAVSDGGYCFTLRDLARFAQMHLQYGSFNGRQIVPVQWIEATRFGDTRDAWKSSSQAITSLLPGGHYRNYWYASGNEHAAFFGWGIYGQFLWLDPMASLVFVKLSADRHGVDWETMENHFRCFSAIGREFAPL